MTTAMDETVTNQRHQVRYGVEFDRPEIVTAEAHITCTVEYMLAVPGRAQN